MKKIGFIGSLASILLGAVILAAASAANEIMPKIGWMNFQKLSSGTYGPDMYVMNFISAMASPWRWWSSGLFSAHIVS